MKRRDEPPESRQTKSEAVRAERARAEARYPAGVMVAVKMPRGDTRTGVVLACRGSIFGEVVTVEFADGKTWSGTAERVRRV